MTRIFLIPSFFLSIELLITRQFYINNRPEFELTNHLFFWGILGFIFALVLIFGFESKASISLFSKNPQAPYDHNAANYLGHTSKGYFDRMTDLSSGKTIFVISVVNLILYFIMI